MRPELRVYALAVANMDTESLSAQTRPAWHKPARWSPWPHVLCLGRISCLIAMVLQAVECQNLVFPARERGWKDLCIEDSVDQAALDILLKQTGEIINMSSLIVTGGTPGDLEALEEFLGCLGALF